MESAGGNSCICSAQVHRKGAVSEGKLHLYYFSFEVLLEGVLFVSLRSCVLSIMYQTGEIVDGFDAQITEGTIIYVWNYSFSPSSGNGSITFVFVV